jgi:hypothetical protein
MSKTKKVVPMAEKVKAHNKFLANGGRMETVEEYLARGGKITKIETVHGEKTRDTVSAKSSLSNKHNIDANSRVWDAERTV